MHVVANCKPVAVSSRHVISIVSRVDHIKGILGFPVKFQIAQKRLQVTLSSRTQEALNLWNIQGDLCEASVALYR